MNRGNGLTVDSAPLPVATVLLEGPAIVGGTLSATVRGATIMFVSSTLTGLSRAVGRWACTFFRRSNWGRPCTSSSKTHARSALPFCGERVGVEK